jgi:hypothetical protein
VSNDLGNPEPFFSQGPTLSERAQLGVTLGEESARLYGRQESLAEALVAPRSAERRHGLSVAVDRLTIAALGLIGSAEVDVR